MKIGIQLIKHFNTLRGVTILIKSPLRSIFLDIKQMIYKVDYELIVAKIITSTGHRVTISVNDDYKSN